MSKRCEMDGQERRVDFAGALRDAGVTALIAFGLFLPLIGFQTVVDFQNSLVLTTRWPMLFTIVAVVGAGRLAFSLAVGPWGGRRPAVCLAGGRAVAPAGEDAAGNGRALALAYRRR